MITQPLIRVKRKLDRWWKRHHSITVRSGPAAGLKLSLRNASADYTHGTNELPVQNTLADHLKPGHVFYDIGANIGFFTLMGARLVGPRGHVYAFEPVPVNAAGVRQNAKFNNLHNITVFESAVSKSSGTAHLLLAQHPGGAKLSTVGTPLNSAIKGVLTVKVVCLDELVAAKVLLPPSVVKIDVEGAELDVLRGMSRILQQFKPVVVCEIDHKEKQAFIRKDRELQDFLCTHGYHTISLEESYPAGKWNVKHVVGTPN